MKYDAKKQEKLDEVHKENYENAIKLHKNKCNEAVLWPQPANASLVKIDPIYVCIKKCVKKCV